MVRCDFLEAEGLNEWDIGARKKAIVHFGSEEAFALADICRHFLPQLVKICDVRVDEDEDWQGYNTDD